MRGFMIFFGLLSSVFDFITFGVLRLGFGAGATLFHTGWFVESVITELMVLMVLRTQRPFFRSRPGNGLVVSSIALGLLTLALPYTGGLAHVLGLKPLSATLLLTLLGITAGYVVAAELVKPLFYQLRVRKSASARALEPARQSR